jgi:hypothetical protein
MTARLFRRFELELYETTEERDVLTRYDCLIGIPEWNSKGIRVHIKRERTE